VRRYEPEDSDRVYRILRSSLDESYGQDVLSYLHLHWPEGQLVICDVSGVAGFISSSVISPGHARIIMFAVDPSIRSKGAGSMLITRFRQAAMIGGISRISLEVRPSNVRAIEFYRRHGFMPAGILKGYYNDGGDAVRMELSVN
jgi:ribosomal-protein-alanine N-acetyltransferase